MRNFVWFLVVLLLVLHQDFWWWDDSQTLVFQIVPIGLAWHALISIMSGVVWALAVRYCWPAGVDVEDGPGSARTAREGHA